MAGTIAILRERGVDAKRLVACSGGDRFKVTVGPASIDRVERFLNHLVAQVRAAGFEIEPKEAGLHVRAESETVAFEIVESLEDKTIVPDPSKLEELARWERKRKREEQAGIFRSAGDRPTVPRLESVPSGRLRLQLEYVAVLRPPPLRRTFADGKTRPLESLIDPIVSGFLLTAVAKRQRREYQERQAVQFAEFKRRQFLEERDRTLQARRVAVLNALLDAQERIERIERLLLALERPSADTAPAVAVFDAWTKSYVAELQAGLHPQALSEEFARTSAFATDQDE